MFILLFLFWMLINGKITLELVIIGLIFSTLVYLFSCAFLRFSFKKDLCLCKNALWFIVYLFLLVIEVVKSNLNIISLIWSNKQPEPEIVHFSIDLESNFLRVMFANAITLTPGTITISLEENHYVVHALRPEYIDGIENSILLKILKKMEANIKC